MFSSLISREQLPEIHLAVSIIFEDTSYLLELGTFAYVTLISTKESRTMRFGFLTAIFNLFPKTEFEYSQRIYEQFEYIALNLTCLCLFILGLVVLLRVLESVSDSIVRSSMEPCWYSVVYCYCDSGWFMMLAFILLLVISTLSYGASLLEYNSWVDYNLQIAADQMFYTFNNFLKIAGVLFVTVILNYFLKISDTKLMFITLIMAIISRMIQVIHKILGTIRGFTFFLLRPRSLHITWFLFQKIL